MKCTYLFTLGCNRIDFINEDDGGGVLLSLLERLSQIALTLSCHLAHDLRAVDQEEERAGLVCDRAGHEGLTRTRRAEHEDTTGRLDTNRLEELGMAKWELNELSDLCHLFAATTNIIVSNIRQVRLLVFPLNWVTLCKSCQTM